MGLRVKVKQGDQQQPLVEYPKTSNLSVPHCTPPSELPWVLEDTPAPTNWAGLSDVRVFFWGGRKSYGVPGVAGADPHPMHAGWSKVGCEQGAQRGAERLWGCRGACIGV